MNTFAETPIGHIVEIYWYDQEFSGFYLRTSSDRIVGLEQRADDGWWWDSKTNYPLDYVNSVSDQIEEFIDHGPYQGDMSVFDSYVTLEEEHAEAMKDD